MSNVAILVSTCDPYEPLWQPFCYSVKKYWPDRPWPMYFLTNHLDAPCGKPLKVGGDGSVAGWSYMQRRGLERLDESAVLLMHEDYWLTGEPDVEALRDFARLVIEGKADKVLLVAGSHTSTGTFAHDDRLQVHAPDSKYRTATHGLWRREALLELLRDGETPWQFESAPVSRSAGYVITSVKEDVYWPHIPPPGALKRGKYTATAYEWLERECF